MTSLSIPTCTAFLNFQRFASGDYPTVARALAALDLPPGSLLVFDDMTCELIDHPWPEGFAPAQPAVSAELAEPPAAPAEPTVGRPRLGVVAREVTLLPRHWDWLAQQRGGASAALRRLVDDARREHADRDAMRLAKERSYRFMSAIGGGLPEFEEASRALFAGESEAFAARTAEWPVDLQHHLAWLNRDVFVLVPEAERPRARKA